MQALVWKEPLGKKWKGWQEVRKYPQDGATRRTLPTRLLSNPEMRFTMPEFNFHACWEDSLIVLNKLIEMKQFTFTLDIPYTEPVPFQFVNITEVVQEVLQPKYHRLYLWNSDYSYFPVRFRPPTSYGTMRIDVLRSGPMLDLTLPVCEEREGKLGIGLGWLVSQPYYIEPETGEAYKPPERLKQAYKEVQKILKKDMVKMYLRVRRLTTRGEFKPAIQPLWFCLNAFKLLEAEEACIFSQRIDYPSITISDLARTRQELEPLVDEYADE